MTWVASEYITLKFRITKQRTQRTSVGAQGVGEKGKMMLSIKLRLPGSRNSIYEGSEER